MRLSVLAAIVLGAALIAAGCGGGSSGGSNTTAPAGGAPKKASAPNAPAGSKVVACKEGAADVEGLRATAVDCGSARDVMSGWRRSHACALAHGASRNSCSLDGFRCQAVKTDRGAAVSCARPGGDLSFVATARPVKKSGSG